MSAGPIFVHSLFRTGSTYLFEVFRRSPAGYWCYQEPLNEYLRHAADAPDRLLEISSRDGALLRHPALDKPYFWEFYQVRDAIAPLFRKELSYDGFFATPDRSSFQDLVSYLRALIDSARGRPFFQCCRTSGRSAALRDVFAGTHIHLWRNPHDQWWSYQIGDYFSATTQRIFNAADLPPPLAAVKASCGIADFHDDDIDKELAHDRNHRLTAREDYVSFYALWLYSMLASERTADLSLNIDALTTSATYRQRVLDALGRIGIGDLNFSDCSIARAPFGAADLAFFGDIEDEVHRIFLGHGIRSDDLAAALELRTRRAGAAPAKFADAAAASSRLRDVAARQMDVLAKTQRDLIDATCIAETRRIGLEAAAMRATSQSEQLVAAQSARDALASTRQRLEHELSEVFAKLTIRSDELLAIERRVIGLQDGLMARDSRIADLQRDTTYWHDIADKLNRDFHALCNSRSWRLTAPLRYTNAYAKRWARAAVARITTLTKLPSFAVRRLSTIAWRFVRARPPLEARLTNFLARHPQANRRLRAFVSRYTDKSKKIISTSTLQPVLPAMPDISGVRWIIYPTAVQRMYLQLIRARMMHSNSPTGREPREDRLK